MHRATFIKWIEMCEGVPPWIIMILPFESCQGSKIDNEGSSFGTRRTSASYMCCHMHEHKTEVVFVLMASDYNLTVEFLLALYSRDLPYLIWRRSHNVFSPLQPYHHLVTKPHS